MSQEDATNRSSPEILMNQEATYDTKRVHLDNLYRMVSYCENIVDCRRAQQLEYFGETFDRKFCRENPRAICDSCSSTAVYRKRDVTDDVRVIVNGIQAMSGSRGRNSNFTLVHYIEVFKGSQNQKIKDLGHTSNPMHGKGSAYSKNDIERLFRQLVVEGVLAEVLHVTAMDHTVSYVQLGKRANEVLAGRHKVQFQVRCSGKAATEVHRVGREPNDARSKVVEDCYNELVNTAKEVARRLSYKNYTSVFPPSVLQQMAQALPLTPDEMRNIDQVTSVRYQKYGEDFLEVTIKYATILASLDDFESPAFDEDTDDPSDLDSTSSSYFNHEPSTSGRGGGRGRGRGVKRKWPGKKKRGGGGGGGFSQSRRGKSTSSSSGPRFTGSGTTSGGASSAGRGWMTSVRGGPAKKPALGQFTFNKKKPSAAASSAGSSSGPSRRPGFLGGPSSRSFLGGGRGAYM